MAEFSQQKADQELKKRQKTFSRDKLKQLFKEKNSLFSKFLNIENLNEYYRDFVDLFSLLQDWYKGRYKDVPWLVISSVGGALLYVLSPIDLIPDFLPFVGYLDDAAVFAALLKYVRLDLQKYRDWKYDEDPSPVIND
ncbi:YkvA family protein [Salegentibacter sediminis]|uniref:YkvA family protein n=1 Tax=Salegentibacter sediminis TaxID=1930251 RepID=UPI0009BCC41A|nr:YkvA family protein [Salegentibacter sediminis]